VVDVQSLAFRTELPLLELSGSEVVDRGTHLVVRTPQNPTYYWGNFLLLPGAPAPGEVERWLAEHRREFPGAGHATLGIDRVDGDLGPLTGAGMRVDTAVAMTAESVHAPPHPNDDATVRRLAGDDWSQLVDLTLAGEEDDPHLTRDFIGRKTDSYRGLVEAGHGHWWGAFDGGRLVASLGIFRAGEGLARFQSVKTHPDHRGRGLCGTLVHRASLDAMETLGAQRLVMVADPDYSAIRVYRSVGFTEGGTHAEATLAPLS
jgi:ribosomal protein S18 acetylase RimI-like enzyme